MGLLARMVLVLFVCLLTVGCDQGIKQAARERLEERPPVTYLDGVVRFEYAENTGAFLSLGSSLPPPLRDLLMIGVNGLILVVVLLVALFSGRLEVAQRLALALIGGGGLGNVIDRLANDGAVVDFVSVGIDGLRTGVFNVADVAIVAGVIAMALFGRIRPDEEAVAAGEEEYTAEEEEFTAGEQEFTAGPPGGQPPG